MFRAFNELVPPAVARVGNSAHLFCIFDAIFHFLQRQPRRRRKTRKRRKRKNANFIFLTKAKKRRRRRRVQGAGGGRGVPVVAFAFFSLLSKNEICVFRLFRVFLLLRGCLLRKRKIASKMQNKWAELPPRATAGGISSLMARNIVKIQLKCNY